MAKGARRRANPTKANKWTVQEKAQRMRLLLILLFVLVPVLVALNWQRGPDDPGPFGMTASTWLLVSGVAYLVIGILGVGVVWWLAKHDQLPKER